MNSPTGVGYSGGIFGCGLNTPYTTALGTRIIPDMYTFPSGSIFRSSAIYNQTNNDVALVTYDNQPVYFCPDDLVFWRKRDIYQPNLYRMYASGPALQCSHAWERLSRRPNSNKNYAGRYDYEFLNAAQPIAPTTTNTTTENPGDTTPPPEQPPCSIADWLIYSNPAAPLWANSEAKEPLLANTYYEGSLSKPPRSSALGGRNFMNFCNPLPARNADGVVLGSYVGFSFMFLFGQATTSFPVRPYLPRDPNSSLPDPPYVNPGQAFYSLEVLCYLASDSDNLASPCIGRKRFWLYSNTGLSGGSNWHDPYFAMYFGPMNSMWFFNVLFPYYSGGTETIYFNLSDMSVMVGA